MLEKLSVIIEEMAHEEVVKKYVLYCPKCGGKTNSNIYHIGLEQKVCNCRKCDWFTNKKTRVTYKKNPVMIGDVIHWMINNLDDASGNTIELIGNWDYFNKPIASQSKDCIEYIYNLINNNARKN